ncbi:hypothetical protein ABZT48_07225 [Streptomyces avermitilis]|uniref:hypothetical protein n=1 Tax=Streptomyces avermitilis TaxID=33903 RepID=UPI00339FF973
MHKHLRLALATARDSTTVPQADFDNAGIGDVVVSAHGAHANGREAAGQVVALYGTATGVPSAITTTGSRTLSPSTSGVSTTGTPQFGSLFAD